jgi:hypothetical protein
MTKLVLLTSDVSRVPLKTPVPSKLNASVEPGPNVALV